MRNKYLNMFLVVIMLGSCASSLAFIDYPNGRKHASGTEATAAEQPKITLESPESIKDNANKSQQLIKDNVDKIQLNAIPLNTSNNEIVPSAQAAQD